MPIAIVKAAALLLSVSACSSTSGGLVNSSGGSNSTTGGSSSLGGASSQSGSTNGGANSTAGSSATAGVPAGDGQAFVPSTIQFNSVADPGSTTLTVLSVTVRDYGDFIGLMAAVRNDLGTPVCNATFNAAFGTATDMFAGQSVLPLASAMYMAQGAAEPCLAVGDIGYGGGAVSFDHVTKFSEITNVDYEPNGTIYQTLDAKITTAELSPVTAPTTPGGGLGGSLTNHGTSTLNNLSASYFALDSGGRPYDFDGAQTDTPLAPGATWAFTFPNESTLGKHVAFASYAIGMP